MSLPTTGRPARPRAARPGGQRHRPAASPCAPRDPLSHARAASAASAADPLPFVDLWGREGYSKSRQLLLVAICRTVDHEDYARGKDLCEHGEQLRTRKGTIRWGRMGGLADGMGGGMHRAAADDYLLQQQL